MRIGIVQSNYLPWRGYFNLISFCDIFVFHDDIRYTSQDWRNRNYINSRQGPHRMTIPVGPGQNRNINQIDLPRGKWRKEHFRLIQQSYSKHMYWPDYKDFIEYIYREDTFSTLSSFNQSTIQTISTNFLKLSTRFVDSSSFNFSSSKQHKVVDLLRELGATEYVSGPAAKAYLDVQFMSTIGIKTLWINYETLVPYPQLNFPANNNLSIIDLLFNCGPRSREFLTASLVDSD